MTFVNAKKQSEHADYDKTNNGGAAVRLPSGATPEQATGDKVTKTPVESGGINRDIKPSNYLGGW